MDLLLFGSPLLGLTAVVKESEGYSSLYVESDAEQELSSSEPLPASVARLLPSFYLSG